MEKVILNIGCGQSRIPGSVGVDRKPIQNFVDVVHNLDALPYPFPDNYADEIHLYHVLEHLHNPLEKMEEFHRILKPGGKLHMKVPHFSSWGAWTDITHIRPFGYFSFDYFRPDHPFHFYTDKIFAFEHRKIKYSGAYPNKGVYADHIHPSVCKWYLKPVVRFFNWLIALSPKVFERGWWALIGGATEIEFIMRKVAE